MSRKKATGFIIYRKVSDQIEYLFLQAAYGKGHWTPPKGHTEEGEDDLTTAYRETKEEAGYSKKDIKVHLNFQVILFYETKKVKEKTVIYWLAELLNPDTPVKLSKEHVNHKWLTLDCAPEYVNFEEMVKALNNCQQFITSTM